MRHSRDAEEGMQDYLEAEDERRQAIIRGEGGLCLPSLQPYLDNVDALGPLSGEENDLFNLTLPRVEQQEEADRRALDEMIEVDQRRMDVIRGIDPISQERFTTPDQYLRRVKALGTLSATENDQYIRGGWQTVVLDSMVEH